MALLCLVAAGCDRAAVQSVHVHRLAYLSFPQFQSPLIFGTPTQGQTLTSTTGAWLNGPSAFQYQWQDCNTLGASCTNINGATASTYLLAAGDVGSTVRLQVIAVNRTSGSLPVYSAVTPVIGSGGPTNTVAPYFCGSTSLPGCSSTTSTATQGQVLTVSQGVWTGSPTSYSYQWDHCTTTDGQPPTTASCSAIGGATSSSYTVAAGDVGKALVPIVTANSASGSTSTTVAGACDAGSIPYVHDDLNATVSDQLNPDPAIAAGCSPISAVAGTTNDTSATGETFCTNSPVTCGFPDPLSNNVGVPYGTVLSNSSATTCGTGSNLTNVYDTNSVAASGTCSITDSRMGGVQANGCTSCTFTNDEFAGGYTGQSSTTTGTGETANISSVCTYTPYVGIGSAGADIALYNTADNAGAQTVSADYIHCAAEPLNGGIGAANSFIISDECWGPCDNLTVDTDGDGTAADGTPLTNDNDNDGDTGTTHNEAIYEYGGQTGLNITGNTILNPWQQTAGLFTDGAWNGMPVSEHVNNNLVAVYDNNGALAVEKSTWTGTPSSNQVENNRFSYLYNSGMNCGAFNGAALTISGNAQDNNLTAITTCP